MKYRPSHLRISGVHAEQLHQHLFPGDGQEAVAFALCGRHRSTDGDVLLVQDIIPVPYSDCPVREPDQLTWRTDAIEPLLIRASAAKLGVVKFHSHPTGYEAFSRTDDLSDRDLFPSVYGWVDDDGPHASVVVLPDRRMFGRSIDSQNRFHPLEQILVVDHDIGLFHSRTSGTLPAHAERHAQVFGERTTSLLRQLTIGVVGCSGTGSFVIEMLARLGVKKLVLVDPDRVEARNLNRIIGTTVGDVETGRTKVEVLGEHVARIGLETRVEVVPHELASVPAVRALAGCDILFGCMDSHDGRRTLNRLACFYVLPYFDCGVGLTADGTGSIHDVTAACHYVQPGRSTLIARNVISQRRADAEAMARRNPAQYRSLHAEKYIEGVKVDSPAVISVNALAASLVVNEFLARLHPFRLSPNAEHASIRLRFDATLLDAERETNQEPLRRALGRGDVTPLLDMTDLSEAT
jgi:predicted metallopeptidase